MGRHVRERAVTPLGVMTTHDMATLPETERMPVSLRGVLARPVRGISS
jgi:hypothetical protein